MSQNARKPQYNAIPRTQTNTDGRQRTQASARATVGKHGPTPRTPTYKREPFATHSGEMAEDMPERISDRMPGGMPERMSDRIPGDMPERMCEYMSERMSQRMLGRMSEDMSDRMSERM